MSKGAFGIAKKVCLGQFTRNEGEIEINRVNLSGLQKIITQMRY
jgi:hypothetical protein